MVIPLPAKVADLRRRCLAFGAITTPVAAIQLAFSQRLPAHDTGPIFNDSLRPALVFIEIVFFGMGVKTRKAAKLNAIKLRGILLGALNRFAAVLTLFNIGKCSPRTGLMAKG